VQGLRQTGDDFGIDTVLRLEAVELIFAFELPVTGAVTTLARIRPRRRMAWTVASAVTASAFVFPARHASGARWRATGSSTVG